MKTIKITNEVEIDFNDVIGQYEESDVVDMIQETSDYFEDYKIDCSILNKIVSSILSCGPDEGDLKTLDIDSLKELLKIVE